MKVNVSSRKLSFFKWSSATSEKRDWKRAMDCADCSRLLADSSTTLIRSLLFRNYLKIYSPSVKCMPSPFRDCRKDYSRFRETPSEYSFNFFE
jgi:hypothetical protein